MKSQTGLIILAISIFASAWIIALQINKSNRPDYSPQPDTGIKVKGGIGEPLNVNVNSNPGNADYYSELKIGDNEKMYIITGHQPAAILIEGDNIVAKYHHLARTLDVVYTSKDSVKHIRYFADPLEWGNKK